MIRDDAILINVLKEIRDEIRESNRNEYRIEIVDVGTKEKITLRILKDKPDGTSGVS